MYDLNKQMLKFYRKNVVLPGVKQDDLIDKKNKNLTRLKDGLYKYNEENGTDYKIIDTIIQGSVAMQTVIQSDENDYDIDVGIAFNKSNLPLPVTSENNTTTVKNIVYNSLLKKSSLFKEDPQKHTNCIRVIYQEGYHIDFAIYRREKNNDGVYIYEHCGADWSYRNPRSITRWFKKRDKEHSYNLKKIVRLIKMYLKQNNSWNVPGGLIQSVLADECLASSERLDIMLYDTISAIIDRLEKNIKVYNPVDVDDNGNKISLLYKINDEDKMNMMKSYLEKGLKKLDVLFEDGCMKETGLRAWGDFFDNEYWAKLADDEAKKSLNEKVSFSGTEQIDDDIYDFDETEEFIDELFPEIEDKYELKLSCKVEQDGSRVDDLVNFLRFNKFLKPKKKLHFSIEKNNVTGKYDIYWKVLNRGIEAEKRNDIRGQIVKGKNIHTEDTKFSGNHIVYCYIVKDGECVAEAHIDVPIIF